eukprot:101251-Prymnesium_polylepis.1
MAARALSQTPTEAAHAVTIVVERAKRRSLIRRGSSTTNKRSSSQNGRNAEGPKSPSASSSTSFKDHGKLHGTEGSAVITPIMQAMEDHPNRLDVSVHQRAPPRRSLVVFIRVSGAYYAAGAAAGHAKPVKGVPRRGYHVKSVSALGFGDRHHP